ncbi:MAG: sulfotransferase domain-containing protein [Candidatus Methanomethyliaceae archaeon]
MSIKEEIDVFDDGFQIDVFCIGTPRSRSTWLKEVLDTHNGIYIPKIKEPNFFVKRISLYTGEDNPRYLRDWNWYRNLYINARKDQLKADFSVNMLYNRHDSAGMVKKFFPSAKFIVVLRDPVDRAYSHYWLDYAADLRSVVPGAFDEALLNSRLVDCSKYYEQVRIWLEYFDKERFFFVFDFDLDKNPRSIIYDLCVFLGIDTKCYEVNNSRVNECFAYRDCIRFLFKVASKVRNIDVLSIRDFAGRTGVWNVVEKFGKVPFEYPSMNPDTRKRLQESLMPDVEKLEKLLCKDLSPWKL